MVLYRNASPIGCLWTHSSGASRDTGHSLASHGQMDTRPSFWLLKAGLPFRSLLLRLSAIPHSVSPPRPRPRWEEETLHLPAWGGWTFKELSLSRRWVGICVSALLWGLPSVYHPLFLAWKSPGNNQDWVRTVTLCFFFSLSLKVLFRITVCCVSVYSCLQVQAHVCMSYLRKLKDSCGSHFFFLPYHVGPAWGIELRSPGLS